MRATILLLALIGCSKQPEALKSTPAPTNAPVVAPAAGQNGPKVTLRNIYVMKVNGAAYVITELENTGNSKVCAFKATWTMLDDLQEKIAAQTLRYTSETPYLSSTNTEPHLIAPGERVAIIVQGVEGEADKTFAVAMDDLGHCGVPIIEAFLKEAKLEDFRAKPKHVTWQVEKVIVP